MSTPFLAQIEIFSFNFAPKGWAVCNGQLLPINQNQALFSLLGTTFGGDGRVNFALPDMRSRIPISMGRENVIGTRAGEESHTVTISEMPAHAHIMMADGTTQSSSNTSSPGSSGTTLLGNSGGTQSPGAPFTISIYSNQAPNNTLAPGVISNAGGSQPHTNIQPYLTLNFCIALQGIFPSRN
jgi:microcystin-dependent protein